MIADGLRSNELPAGTDDNAPYRGYLLHKWERRNRAREHT